MTMNDSERRIDVLNWLQEKDAAKWADLIFEALDHPKKFSSICGCVGCVASNLAWRHGPDVAQVFYYVTDRLAAQAKLKELTGG